MKRVDEEKFHRVLWDMIGRVLLEQEKLKDKNPEIVDLRSGWFGERENYKRDIWEKAQNVLKAQERKEEEIGTGCFLNAMLQCMDESSNLLDWHKNAIKEKLLRHKMQTEQVLYQIFCGKNEEEAFEKAAEAWGRDYALLSFCFFLKEKNRSSNDYQYLPVRPEKMKQKFAQLGITTTCLDKATWENYKEYILILEEVRNLLRTELGNKEVDMLDAHSYVWSLYLLEKDEHHPLTEEAEKIETECAAFQGGTRNAVIKARINASKFRKKMLKENGACKLCGLDNQELLIVSHIKPWTVSNGAEKVDTNNAFMLCPNHDKLFDQGWISFEDDGTILISEQLKQKERNLTNVQPGQKIKASPKNAVYLEYHRENIFKKTK